MTDPAPGLVRSPQCGWLLGRLPCDNTEPHKGRGKGCTHDAGDYDRRDYDRRDRADSALEQ